MAPIDPSNLLNALDALLSPEGGIRSTEEVLRLSSLMKKFSKKLVSRCVYCNVLKATKPEILSDYLDKGGWETINLWLQETKESNYDSFLLELLKLCKILPMTVARLKENNTAKVIKSLTKHENSEIKSISNLLLTKWISIVSGGKNTEGSTDKKKKKSKVAKSGKSEKAEKPEKSGEKTQSDSPKSPGRLKGSKRSSSEKDTKKVEYYEDVKIDPEPLLPSPKKPRTDRPKTAKLYQKKFRATGLEEEMILPKNISKKAPTVNKNAAAAVAKKEVAKMLTSTVPERIHEKKIKPENLVPTNETSIANKGIKLIPAKPRPAHILHESASFMDALISQPVAPVKKKKKVLPNKPATSPTSPTIVPPKLEFYKDTLEMNEEIEIKKEDSTESASSEEKVSIPSENADEPMETDDKEQGGQTPPNNEDSNNGISSPVPEAMDEVKDEDVKPDPAQLQSILAHGKRRGKKKSVRWVEDSNLKEILYFEMDETERVNVNKTKANFGDLKSIEAKREREQYELSKRHAGDRMEETISWWTVPILIDIPPLPIEPGFQSKEREIQRIRQQSILQEIYFTREMVPDSPHEPDLEIVAPQEPKVIPLEEESSTGAVMDYSSFEAATPVLPEVLTSLMKIPTRPNQQPIQNIPQEQVAVNNIPDSVVHNPNPVMQPHIPHTLSAPYDPGEPVSIPPNNPGIHGIPPPIQNMYNMPPPDANVENIPPSSDWRTLEMIQQQEQQQQQQFFGYPMNHMRNDMDHMRNDPMDHMRNDPMDHHMRNDPMDHMRNDPMAGMNMRPRMMQDMFRPNMPNGPMHMNMGPMRGRGFPRVPCRHFIAGGCRFGIKCSFLHPGVNGPPL